METFDFYGHKLSRVFKGNWQLAGGHGNISHDDALEVLEKYADHGVNAYDVGDIYTGAENLLGEFVQLNAKSNSDRDIRVHTKFVPDLDALETLSEQDIRSVIERSLRRLGLPALHLVQFHWWDFSKGDYVAAGLILQKLKNEGLIEQIGVTNTDVHHLNELLGAGVEVVSNQIQFSLIDPRPLNGMLKFAKENDIKLFCYGVLAGGLLGNSKPGNEPMNRSHIKYGLMVDEAGEDYYESTLNILEELANKYDTTRANIAAAFILSYPEVSSVILGPRNAAHVAELDALTNLKLEDADSQLLRDRLAQFGTKVDGDIYSYERDMNSRHGSIMKYNLNGMRT